MDPLITPSIIRGGVKKHQASIETPPGDVNDLIIFRGLGGRSRRLHFHAGSTVAQQHVRDTIFPLTKRAQSDYKGHAESMRQDRICTLLTTPKIVRSNDPHLMIPV